MLINYIDSFLNKTNLKLSQYNQNFRFIYIKYFRWRINDVQKL